jgi:hypothetical protein
MRRIFGGQSNPDPRFIAGTLEEIEELFGSRVPELPDGPLDPSAGDVFLVDIFPPLRKSLRDLVEYLYRGMTAAAGGGEHAAFAHGGRRPLDSSSTS